MAESKKTTFKSVVYHPDKTIRIDEVEFPKVSDDDVLIKVAESPINPVDTYQSKGTYTASIPPYPLGVEGSGVVVEVGKNHSHRFKCGDKVSFVSFSSKYGCWAEYVMTSGSRVFAMHPENSFRESASHFVNPVTVVMMLRQVQKEGHKAVIQTAAASSIGRMMIMLFKAEGIKTINLVRRDNVKDELLAMGADYVLNTTDADFEKKLEEIAAKENATKCFDAIGGEFTMKVLRKMPFGSTMTVYGGLAGEFKFDVTLMDLFSGKTLNGYVVTPYFEMLPLEEKEKIMAYVQARLKTTLKTWVAKTFSLDKIVEAIEFAEKNTALGKVIIKF